MHEQVSLQSLIEDEYRLTMMAHARYGSFVGLVTDALALLNSLVKTIDRSHFLAAATMLSIKKVSTLAFLSLVRQHLAQAEANSRQLIEFTALAAYLIAHPDKDVTGHEHDPEKFLEPQKLTKRVNDWLSVAMPVESAALKELKSQINDTSAHASVYLTHLTFDWERNDQEEFAGSFFDREDVQGTQLYLMNLAKTVYLVVRTIRIAGQTHGGFHVADDAEERERNLGLAVLNHRNVLAKARGWKL